MTRTWRDGLLVVGLALTTSGCLLKERTDTWYLDPNGGVTWSVIEKDVRSDAASAADRESEEAKYMAGVQAGMHPVANGFRLFGAIEARTRILRGTLPYSIVIEARFQSVEELGQRIAARVGVGGSSLLTHDGPNVTWTLMVRDPRATDALPQSDDDVDALIEGLGELKVVLTAGRFDGVGTRGFRISSDGRVATLADDPADVHTFEEGGLIVWRLTWTVR